MFKTPEQYRKKDTRYPDGEKDSSGVFEFIRGNLHFFIIASSGMGWEHVSVSLRNTKEGTERCPTWNEMCHIKDLFWDKEDCIVQYHPAEKDYVNNHPYCLHLWRPTDQILPVPYHQMVGIKN